MTGMYFQMVISILQWPYLYFFLQGSFLPFMQSLLSFFPFGCFCYAPLSIYFYLINLKFNKFRDRTWTELNFHSSKFSSKMYQLSDDERKWIKIGEIEEESWLEIANDIPDLKTVIKAFFPRILNTCRQRLVHFDESYLLLSFLAGEPYLELSLDCPNLKGRSYFLGATHAYKYALFVVNLFLHSLPSPYCSLLLYLIILYWTKASQ